MAGTEGDQQEAKVRTDIGEEDEHTDRGAVQGIPGGILHVPELLPDIAVRGAARLHVSASAVQVSDVDFLVLFKCV